MSPALGNIGRVKMDVRLPGRFGKRTDAESESNLNSKLMMNKLFYHGTGVVNDQFNRRLTSSTDESDIKWPINGQAYVAPVISLLFQVPVDPKGNVHIRLPNSSSSSSSSSSSCVSASIDNNN